ncbi:MAG: HAMP domain-containing histidine kinase [Spirochaetales bacterium]|nr:HAMP domain-containing histidine kinase [Spirochaetales bacterium]
MIHWKELVEKDNLSEDELLQIPGDNITNFHGLISEFNSNNWDIDQLLCGTNLELSDFKDYSKWINPIQSEKLLANYLKCSPLFHTHTHLYNITKNLKDDPTILSTIIRYTPYSVLLSDPEIATSKIENSFYYETKEIKLGLFSFKSTPKGFKKKLLVGYEPFMVMGYIEKIHKLKNIKIKNCRLICSCADITTIINNFYYYFGFEILDDYILLNKEIIAKKYKCNSLPELIGIQNWSDDDKVFKVLKDCTVNNTVIFNKDSIYNAPFDYYIWNTSKPSLFFERVLSKMFFYMKGVGKKLNYQLDQNNKSSKDLLQMKALIEQEHKSREIMLANIVHEIKSPIASIVMLVDSIGEYTDSIPDFVLEGFKQLGNKSGKLIQFVDNVISYFSIDNNKISLKKEPIDLAFLINDVMDHFSYIYESKVISLISTVTPDRFIINGDYYRLLQVFLNIISNSIKFTNQGEIKVTAGFEDFYIKITISDTGIGIEKSKLQTIFNQFIQNNKSVSKNFNGLGLGLYISKNIVEKHSGRITVESKLGIGSSFHIYLPFYTDV